MPSDDQVSKDQAYFEQAMKHVMPLDSDQCTSPLKHTAEDLEPAVRIKAPHTVFDPQTTVHFHFRVPFDHHHFDTDQPLKFSKSGVSLKPLKRLTQSNIESSIDLHGMTQDQASTALASWLSQALNHRYRIVHIIHGKGVQGVLKMCVNEWLQTHPSVLGFCSAQPQHGGTGALYVLLKQRN